MEPNGKGVSDKVMAEFQEEQAWELTEEEIEIVLKELEARAAEAFIAKHPESLPKTNRKYDSTGSMNMRWRPL